MSDIYVKCMLYVKGYINFFILSRNCVDVCVNVLAETRDMHTYSNDNTHIKYVYNYIFNDTHFNIKSNLLFQAPQHYSVLTQSKSWNFEVMISTQHAWLQYLMGQFLKCCYWAYINTILNRFVNEWIDRSTSNDREFVDQVLLMKFSACADGVLRSFQLL